MRNLILIIFTTFLCGCGLLKTPDGNPSITHEEGVIETEKYTWFYDYLLVKEYYKSLPDAHWSEYTDYHNLLTNNKGVGFDLQQSIYILQRNGSYKKADLSLLEGASGITLFLHNRELKIILRLYHIKEKNRLTDCYYPKDKSYMIGYIDTKKNIIKFDSVLESPQFEDFKLTDGYYYQYTGKIFTQPFECN